ncbi:unnamed protein product [Ectocarpus sp. 12 AP-2014]
MRHRHRALFVYSAVTFLPSSSFVPPRWARLLPSSASAPNFQDKRSCRGAIRSACTAQHANSRRVGSERPPEFLSDDDVLYFHDPNTSSKIWLVGTTHNTKASSKLVKKVVRRVKPKVVMVEIDPCRIKMLPPGEATKDGDGLWWWNAVQEAGPATAVTSGDRDKDEAQAANTSRTPGDGLEKATNAVAGTRRRAKNEMNTYAMEMSEFYAAARQAVACGARVLLGDRDFQETTRRVSDADRADQEEAMSPLGDNSAGKKTTVEARIKRRALEGTSPAVWRKLRDLEKTWRPRKFAVLVTERDEVMASNLLKLEEGHGTVAVVGAHHTIGIGGILKANGWKTRRR